MVDDKVRREIVLRLKTEMLSIGSAFISDYHIHTPMPSASEEHTQALKMIGNKASIMISPFSLRGWLRHSIESYLIENGIEVCHPMNKDSKPSKENKATGRKYIEEDMEYGYHSQGQCLENGKPGCLIVQMFGSLTKPGTLMQKQVITQPVIGRRDFTHGIGSGSYRMVQVSPTTRSPLGIREPFRTHETDIVAFMDVPWRIKIRENVPEDKTKIYTGLLCRAADHMDTNREDFFRQLGGKRNMGCGIMRVSIVNPLYDEDTLKTMMKPPKKGGKSSKEGETTEEEVEAFDQSRPAGTGFDSETDEQWEKYRKVCETALDRELEEQRKIYPYAARHS